MKDRPELKKGLRLRKMNSNYIEKIITKLKKASSDEVDRCNYDMALTLISLVAIILYKTNIRYADYDLENILRRIGDKLEIVKIDRDKINEDIVLFWDGFGLNDRGLIQIYMKALCKIKKVVYVTYEDRKDKIPDVINILDHYHAEIRYINRKKRSNIDMLLQLNGIVNKVNPAHFFFYSVPDDVVATPLLYEYNGILKRYQVNLTDHAFWIGAGCCDKCINFRAYGAKVSKEYRNIGEERNVVIPFYPIVHREREFQGFPFTVGLGQKVLFSGGSLYKTIGDDNRYYHMVDHILSKHENVIFWYAGGGNDTQLRKILVKYPSRAFHTEERSDLFQVLEHCDVYLSTYPMCGGLMFQYSSLAGIIPLTLKFSNISDEFLIDQAKIRIEFETEEELYKEADKLLTDEEYASERRKLIKQSVISPFVFEEEVKKLINGQDSDAFSPKYEHIDTEAFKKWCLSQFSWWDIDAMTVRRNSVNVVLKHCPLELLKGVVCKLIRRFFIRLKL